MKPIAGFFTVYVEKRLDCVVCSVLNEEIESNLID